MLKKKPGFKLTRLFLFYTSSGLQKASYINGLIFELI